MTKIGHNERTSLPEAMVALLPTERKELVHTAMVECMQVEGEKKSVSYTPAWQTWYVFGAGQS